MLRGPEGHGRRGRGRKGMGEKGPDGSGHGRRRRGSRLFDYGELRLLILDMISDNPSHGYELIKQIEELTAGAYSPSPGVIYPTLSWLEDMGYGFAERDPSGRKQFTITDEGRSFLEANRGAIAEIKARSTQSSGHGRLSGPPPAITRAMENLRTALRLRLRDGSLDDAATQKIADALDASARAIEQS